MRGEGYPRRCARSAESCSARICALPLRAWAYLLGIGPVLGLGLGLGVGLG